MHELRPCGWQQCGNCVTRDASSGQTTAIAHAPVYVLVTTSSLMDIILGGQHNAALVHELRPGGWQQCANGAITPASSGQTTLVQLIKASRSRGSSLVLRSHMAALRKQAVGHITPVKLVQMRAARGSSWLLRSHRSPGTRVASERPSSLWRIGTVAWPQRHPNRQRPSRTHATRRALGRAGG